MNSQSKKSKLRVGSMAASCLLEIANMTELWLANAHRPYLAFRFGLEDALEIRALQAQASKRRALRRLKERRLVRLKKVGLDYEAQLTNDGVAEALRLQVASAPALPKEELCIVVFDVPMEHHRYRRKLRRFLKWAGFEKTQQSVWISRKDTCQALVRLFKTNRVDMWIRVFRGREVKNH